MPKGQSFHPERILKDLRDRLSQEGPTQAPALCNFLNISQPVFSRIIKQAGGSVLRFGQGRRTFYACDRSSSGGKRALPVFIVKGAGEVEKAATLYPLAPQGYYVESHTRFFTSQLYKHFPYFFEDMRPSGFLGRLIPQLYPELDLPTDIAIWTDDHALSYLTSHGEDLIGNLILGEPSCDHYLAAQTAKLGVIAKSEREKQYPRLAELVLSQGLPGSSAGGEQPKFLSTNKAKMGLFPVIVKFSPPVSESVGQRMADLLVCEHIAHGILKKHGKKAPSSELLKSENRLFLEIVRFDRNPTEGRLGLVSLRALDLEFVGELKSWSETARSLCHQKKIRETDYHDILWLEVFGKLIANTDRHHGNISLFCDGEKITELAPAYDMLPMMYAPQQNQLVARDFVPDPPKALELPVWKTALIAARDFWLEVQKHPHVSPSFKKLTSQNAHRVSQLPCV